MIILVFTNIPPIAFVAAALDILVSMAVHAASEWQGWLINFLSVIGYRSGCCDAVVIEDFVLFRQMKYTRLNQESWNMRHRLPTGLAATGAAFVSWAVVSPGIDAEWYAGPAGKKISDIGLEGGFVVTISLLRHKSIRVEAKTRT